MSVSGTQYVWYGSYGSNLCAERFRCYLAGGRPPGASVEQPGARDSTVPFAVPPTRQCPTSSIVVPHRMFFAKASPWWSNGGVAFLDVTREEEDASLHSVLRLYRITLDQWNDVLAQESGLNPNEEAAVEARLTVEEVLDMARTKSGHHRIPKSWYGYVQCLGYYKPAEPVLTFTLPPSDLLDIRTGIIDEVNPPSPAYHDIIARGLVEIGGHSRDEADAYLRSRYALA
ncbi:unnamed product [Ostreococcus tauri]|uniref:Unnamed product n=1 Tax=Ostreococcus tauri TaxID=70448 RepID=A0A090M417_OSTTA|nr:unnamed product [Ostreococcus tauri]CEF97397.1 unnamed product [Ostreococcus tauri]|eukprot:XP_022838669.1 unnamed product [Ostreococcus tauri]